MTADPARDLSEHDVSEHDLSEHDLFEHDLSEEYCGETVRRALDLIGGKWTMLILWELLGREYRYADLQRQVGGVSQKVLSSELKSLVRAGLVEREVTPTVPPQVTYRLTQEGRSLREVFAVLHRWGLRHG